MQKVRDSAPKKSPCFPRRRPAAIWLAACLALAGAAAADEIELNSGRRYRGLVLNRTATEITFKAVMGGGTAEMTIPLSMVRSVTIDGKMPVPERPAATKPKPKPSSQPAVSPGPEGHKPPASNIRTPAEIDAIISKAGKTQPAWWDQEQLDYPKTLDLHGTNPVKGWAPNRNLGAYVWSVIQPNTRRWRGGVKLLHHVVGVRKDDPKKLAEAMEMLARLYHKFLKDWARAAFWYRQSQRRRGQRARYATIAGLADCYWHLGSKAMATGLLRRYRLDRRGGSHVIQLWAEMGELKTALMAAKGWAALGRRGPQETAYLAAGNACRKAGKLDQALAYYQKLLGLKRNKPTKMQVAARAAVEAIKLYEALDLASIPDNTYTGQCMGYRGPITVKVTVQAGRIESVQIVSHREDLFYTAFTDIPKGIVEKQGLKGVDAVTGATVTCEAIINATAKALSKGMQ